MKVKKKSKKSPKKKMIDGEVSFDFPSPDIIRFKVFADERIKIKEQCKKLVGKEISLNRWPATEDSVKFARDIVIGSHPECKPYLKKRSKCQCASCRRRRRSRR